VLQLHIDARRPGRIECQVLRGSGGPDDGLGGDLADKFLDFR
jgi:hypothetical protein